MDGKTSAKAEQRRMMRAALSEIGEVEISRYSKEIRDHLKFQPGSKVAIFAGTSSEVQLLDLIPLNPEVDWFLPRVTGKTTMEFLPVTDPSELQKGCLGILEPHSGHPPSDLDLIVCPGLAFTKDGLRLGQGGGYYDRALEQYSSSERIGVCLSCQIVDQLPIDPHDITMHRVVTNLPEPPG